MSSSFARMAVLAVATVVAGSELFAQQTQPASDPAEPVFAAADVEFFEKQVRPLLAARCQECHGARQQKGGLRLDSRAAVLAGGDTGPAAEPGKPDESLLVDAIRYGDIYQMPPKSQLPAEEIATLVEWVRRGLPWGAENAAHEDAAANGFDLHQRAEHWSFHPLAAAPLPAVRDTGWIANDVDRFILARLEAASLQPAPAADKRTLLRRVTYNLTGLPPTPGEIDAFLADNAPGAYARVVDRLLASPHYGERWARHWLDLVRYAETHGHEFDFEMPNAYRYRDYVIRAFNDDLPYDQFVIEQVAGDLLPNPRRDAKDGHNQSIIATGFFFLGEAKHSPVDVRQDEADRIDNQIDVFSKTFLGLTVACARCHDHKFDAISTKDYYALAGYLQSSRYQQAFIDPPEKFAAQLEALENLREARQRVFRDLACASRDARLSRLRFSLPAQSNNVTPPDILFGFTRGFADWQPTGQAFSTRPGDPLELPSHAPAAETGKSLGAFAAHSGLLSNKLHGVLRSPTFEISSPKLFYRLYGAGGQVRLILDGLQLIQNPIYGGLKFEPQSEQPYWHTQDVSKWIGHRAYIELVDEGDGYVALEAVAQGDAEPSAAMPNRLLASLLAEGSNTTSPPTPDELNARYAALVGEAFDRWLAHFDAPLDPAQARDWGELLAPLFHQDIDWNALGETGGVLRTKLAELATRQREIESRLPMPARAMALADGTAENERVFIRGNHKQLGDEVPRRFLEALGGAGQAPPEQGSGRLELARQLVSPDNPLTARVMVNRLWHHHFGAGLVRSPDDFGVMGQSPTHPELLDYLARQFIREGWSLKAMHRLLVLSNTYQMSSEAQPQADAVDPQNKLWHRMQVRRLEAESVRDAILAVSGRADYTLYGPSIMPHLTEYMTGRGRPAHSGPLDGAGRRSIYLSVRRNFLSPLFLAFDYPTPFTTIGRRSTSNVPAQALAMLNNPFVVEQAHLWAKHVLAGPDASNEQRVQSMYVTALGRAPDEAELSAALVFLKENTVPADPAAAWADLAHVLFNVKEFIFIR